MFFGTNFSLNRVIRNCNGIVKVVPFLAFDAFQKEMQKCRFLFVPNIADASPRVITEAICYNMPVLVNRNILGGWHYVEPGVTGEFFTPALHAAPRQAPRRPPPGRISEAELPRPEQQAHEIRHDHDLGGDRAGNRILASNSLPS